MAKYGSFGFAEGAACGWGKTKCAIYERIYYCFLVFVNFVCAVAMKIQNILCGGKKIKTQKGWQ
jgi:hypothetical protein